MTASILYRTLNTRHWIWYVLQWASLSGFMFYLSIMSMNVLLSHFNAMFTPNFINKTLIVCAIGSAILSAVMIMALVVNWRSNRRNPRKSLWDVVGFFACVYLGYLLTGIALEWVYQFTVALISGE